MITLRDKSDILKMLDSVDSNINKNTKKETPQEILQRFNATIDHIDELISYREVLLTQRNKLIRQITEDIMAEKNIGEQDHDEIMSIAQVAKKLGCHRQTVYSKHIKNGLRIVNPTGSQRQKVLKSDFRDYLEKIKNNALKNE